MTISVSIGGKNHDIDLGPGEPQITAVETGVYSVLLDGRSYEARVEETDGAIVVFVGGYRFEAEIHDPRRWSRQAKRQGTEGRLNVTALMPGKVVRLLVNEGEAVTAGQGLLVMEAMKMQNEMKSPKTGVVISLAARVGATVAAGDVLASIE